MAIDGSYDGKITIKKGQGISQAIRDELGLTQEECSKLGRSVWENIFKEVASQNKENKIYEGGDDLSGPTNKNFVVKTGQTIEFTKQTWNKIVEIINYKLDKTEGSDQTEETPTTSSNIPAKDQTPPADDQTPPADNQNPPPKDNRQPSIIPSRYKDTSVMINSKFVTYDKNGYEVKERDQNQNLTRKISRNPDGSVEFYVDYEYDKNGKRSRGIQYNPDGSVDWYEDYEYDENGNKTKQILYNPNGSVDKYIDFEYDEKGNTTRRIRYSPNGSVNWYADYEYDENGKRSRVILYNPDGSVDEYADYEYDENGNETRWIKYNPDGTIRE